MTLKSKNTFEFLVGASVLVIATFFFVFAYKNSGAEAISQTQYKAAFDRIDGLVEGSDVRMSGVKVGRIVTMSIDPKTYMAHVTFSVNEDLKLPKDSSAEVVSDGLLGGKYLAIVPGGDEVFLESGGEIFHTQSSVNLEAMIGQLIFSNNADKEQSGSN